MVSRRKVRIWAKGGESMRSAVSSRRRRRGAVDGGGHWGRFFGGNEGGEGMYGGFVVGGDLSMPDSRRTSSSWS